MIMRQKFTSTVTFYKITHKICVAAFSIQNVYKYFSQSTIVLSILRENRTKFMINATLFTLSSQTIGISYVISKQRI